MFFRGRLLIGIICCALFLGGCIGNGNPNSSDVSLYAGQSQIFSVTVNPNTSQVSWTLDAKATGIQGLSFTYKPTAEDIGDHKLIAKAYLSQRAWLIHVLPKPEKPESVAYQINVAHSGFASFGKELSFPQTPTWSIKFGTPLSYPLIAEGKVFILTPNADYSYGTELYALDEASGKTIWGPVAISGTYYWSGHAYDNGMLFIINFDGLLRCFDAASGQLNWSTQLPNQYAFSSLPTATDGVVYIGGAGIGGTLYAVNELNGNLIWTADVMNGDESSPAVSEDGVFVSYPCQVYKFDRNSGKLLWQHSGGCEGGGGKTAAYANGFLYVRDLPSTSIGTIYNASDGSIVGNFGGYQMSPIPALGSSMGYFLYDGKLNGINLSSFLIDWSFTGDGNLVSAPIIIDQVVIVGSSSGNVYAIDTITGKQLWMGKAGDSIAAPDEQNVSQPLTGFGAGDGYLIVPAGNTLTAWRLIN